jgi:hypothetical protein
VIGGATALLAAVLLVPMRRWVSNERPGPDGPPTPAGGNRAANDPLHERVTAPLSQPRPASSESEANS